MVIEFHKTNDIEKLFRIRENSLRSYFQKRGLVWDSNAQLKKYKNDWGHEKAFLAIKNGEAVGSIALETKPESLNITKMYMLEEFQRRGIGTQILDAFMIEYYNPQKPFTLNTDVENHEAQSFYTKLGFIETGRDDEHIYYINNFNQDGR